MIFHWLFIIITLLLCAVAALPTRFWLRTGEWAKARGLRGKQVQLKDALAAQRHPFTPDESFLDRGVGLAVDHERKLVFLACPQNGAMRAEILPSSALGPHEARILSDNGFQENFVEILTPGLANPVWRLPCGDTELAAEVDSALARL
ncbi:MAG: hypothetical protein KGQ26_09895 [Rhodospirillales bacterium]|nr:hypothetical protein [Rhodospirillales bacterium]MDE2318356.1 hypothetical protein [Rhodospirillales bacterium]